MVKVLSSQDLAVVDSGKSLEENMKGLKDYLSNEEFLKGISFNKVDDETYSFDIDIEFHRLSFH